MTRLEQARMAAFSELDYFINRAKKHCIKEGKEQFFERCAKAIRAEMEEIFDTVSDTKGTIQARRLLKGEWCQLCGDPLTVKQRGDEYSVECAWTITKGDGLRIIGKGQTIEEALEDYRSKEK